ncbi:nucleoporin protein Ndc1-Nup [Clohesyomyces aquaticus]|uniref:Nucleoporin protein Ndc1-Nup n=1 Tax=Clohesyomyces aquaticus TaxID=1231657 RepID=A0A1Y1ZKQ9_9PLEO|nr:nucleoporin protein Ndc1-Nup [Clohesyomyces aquaticus]
MASPIIPTRPYRDFMTPALHRRFMSASIYTFGLCYAIAIWMGQWDSLLWAVFPFGPVGMRALLLFIPALSVYVLRVSQWHVGKRNYATPYKTFTEMALSINTFATLAIYSFSAWFYGEVYVWSRPGEARLGFTDQGKLYERIKLNERPLYLRYLFIALAVAQAVFHLWKDYDTIDVPGLKPKQERKETDSALAPKSKSTSDRLIQKCYIIGPRAFWTMIFTFVGGNVVYFFGFRWVLWSWYYWFMRFGISLAKASKPTGLPPFFNLVGMFAAEGFLLALLWDFTNVTFDLYISEEPLKKDQPITSDSKDPNGSLLNGLKSKKGQVNNIAFWELAMITDRFDARRKSLFGDLERKKGPTYEQVTNLCLKEIKNVVNRIDNVLGAPASAAQAQPTNPASLALIPRISEPLKQGQIIAPEPLPTTRLGKLDTITSKIARAHSSPQNAADSKARELLKKGQTQLTEGTRQAESFFTVWQARFVASPIGWPWRNCIRRIANSIINGAPYSRQSAIMNAITALTNLTVASLREDEYGQFKDKVPEIIRQFSEVITKIEVYMQGLEVHWTDVDCLAKPEAQRKKIPEVDAVLDSLKEGLERILRAFNEYLGNMGMSRQEIMEAKKLVGKQNKEPQMVEVGG